MGENYKKYLKRGSAFLVAPALFGSALPGSNASAVFSFDDVKKFFGKVFSMEWIYAIWRMIKFGESEEKKEDTKIKVNSMEQKKGNGVSSQSKGISVPLVNKVEKEKPDIQEMISKKVSKLRKNVSSFDEVNRKITFENRLEVTYSWKFYRGDWVLCFSRSSSPSCPLLCLPDKGESVLFVLDMDGSVDDVFDLKNAVSYRPKVAEKSRVNGKLSSINYNDPSAFIKWELKPIIVDIDYCNTVSCLLCLRIIQEQDKKFWALKDQFKPIVSNSLNNNNVGFMNLQQQVVQGFNNNNFLGNPGYNNVGMMNMMPQVYSQQNMPQNMQQGNNNFNGGYPNQQGGGYNQNYSQFQMMIPQ